MEKKSKFFWLKIAITIISFGGAVLFKSTIDWTNIQNNYIDLSLLKEIAYDLSIGVFSAMILVWFIDEIGQHRPGAGRLRCPGFSGAGPGPSCHQLCGGHLRVPLARGYGRPSFREAHEPFHPIRVQCRLLRQGLLLVDHLGRQVAGRGLALEGRGFQGGAVALRRRRRQVEHRRRKAQAPDRPVPVPFAQAPIAGERHLQVRRIPAGAFVGGKGRGKHQPRR